MLLSVNASIGNDVGTGVTDDVDTDVIDNVDSGVTRDERVARVAFVANSSS